MKGYRNIVIVKFAVKREEVPKKTYATGRMVARCHTENVKNTQGSEGQSNSVSEIHYHG